jgi:hypothetical protein
MTNVVKTKQNGIEQDLLLSDDEIDLIWFLPYLTERNRVQEVAKAQLDKALEFFMKLERDVPIRCSDYASQPINS